MTKHALLPLTATLALLGCAPESTVESDMEAIRRGGAAKADVCHWDADAEAYVLLNVSTGSAHFDASKHAEDAAPGDWYADADGDGFGAGTPTTCPASLTDTTDGSDAFPADPTEWADSDGDGVGDNSDLCDGDDASGDTDGDAVCDDIDPDIDGDGFDNADDCDPLDAGVNATTTFYADGEGDGLGDPAESVDACEAPSGYVDNADDLCPTELDEDGDGCELSGHGSGWAEFDAFSGLTAQQTITGTVAGVGFTMVFDDGGAGVWGARGNPSRFDNSDATWERLYYTPNTTADSLSLVKFSGSRAGTLTITFDSPVTDPVFHFAQMDAASWDFAPSGGTLTTLSSTGQEATAATGDTWLYDADGSPYPNQDGYARPGTSGSWMLGGTWTQIDIDLRARTSSGDGYGFQMSL